MVDVHYHDGLRILIDPEQDPVVTVAGTPYSLQITCQRLGQPRRILREAFIDIHEHRDRNPMGQA
jgi:hypothetical protein